MPRLPRLPALGDPGGPAFLLVTGTAASLGAWEPSKYPCPFCPPHTLPESRGLPATLSGTGVAAHAPQPAPCPGRELLARHLKNTGTRTRDRPGPLRLKRVRAGGTETGGGAIGREGSGQGRRESWGGPARAPRSAGPAGTPWEEDAGVKGETPGILTPGVGGGGTMQRVDTWRLWGEGRQLGGVG